MVEGERTRFWIPENLAYEGKGDGRRGMLVFDIELVAINRVSARPPGRASP